MSIELYDGKAFADNSGVYPIWRYGDEPTEEEKEEFGEDAYHPVYTLWLQAMDWAFGNQAVEGTTVDDFITNYANFTEEVEYIPGFSEWMYYNDPDAEIRMAMSGGYEDDDYEQPMGYSFSCDGQHVCISNMELN